MEEAEHSITIRDRFRIDVLGREFPDGTFWDRNFLIVVLSATDNVSRVEIRGPCLLTCDLATLLGDIRDLLTGRATELELTPIEPEMRLLLKASGGKGHFDLQVWLHSHVCGVDWSSSSHEYRLQLDRTDLQTLEDQLSRVLETYPVIGQP